jgi:hypothetical protein
MRCGAVRHIAAWVWSYRYFAPLISFSKARAALLK